MIIDFINNTKKIWWAIFSLLHFIGKLLVVCLFIFSSSTVINFFFGAIGYPDLIAFVKPFGEIYGDTLPWAATSMLLASSVAIGHMRNLEINEEKLTAEIRERAEKKYNAKNGESNIKAG